MAISSNQALLLSDRVVEEQKPLGERTSHSFLSVSKEQNGPSRRFRAISFLRGIGSILNIFSSPRFDYKKKNERPAVARAWGRTCRNFDFALSQSQLPNRE